MKAVQKNQLTGTTKSTNQMNITKEQRLNYTTEILQIQIIST